MALTRIVTFLGMGRPSPPHYTPTRYTFDGLTSPQTFLHDIIDLQVGARSGDISLLVLGTESVRQRWFGEESLYLDELKQQGFGGLVPGFVTLPEGKTEAERWEIFRRISTALSREAMTVGEPIESEAPGEILFDITHGFRSQSILATAAVEFVQSEWQRQGVGGPLIRILYAAFEAREEGVTPVWDLTWLSQAHAWNRAVDGLMRYGRADELRTMLGRLQGQEVRKMRARGEKGGFPQLSGLGKQAGNFADSLTTTRIPGLLTRQGAGLHAQLQRSLPDVARLVPPLVPAMSKLAEWTAALSCERVISLEGVRAAVALGEVYRQTQRFSELAALLRETAVTLWTVDSVEAPLEPGEKGFDTQRHEMDRALGACCWELIESGGASSSSAVWLFQQVSELRNDIQHGGFREQSMAANRLRKRLSGLLDGLRERVSEDAVVGLE